MSLPQIILQYVVSPKYDISSISPSIKSADFDGRVDVLPVADPNIMSMAQRVTLAQTQLQIASSNPQIHNLHEAYRRVYEALGTKQIETLMKPAPKQPAKPISITLTNSDLTPKESRVVKSSLTKTKGMQNWANRIKSMRSNKSENPWVSEDDKKKRNKEK